MAAAAIYTRISSDDTGQQTATHRQEDACRAFATYRQWDVADVFEDVDLSAYKLNVHRPAYERLLQAVAARDVEIVLVWKLDRLARRPAEFERFWAACEAKDVALASVTEPIDTTNEIGLAIVRVLITFASLESATKSLRLRAKFREMAEQGKAWSGHRPFGHTKDWQHIVPEEADAIRNAAQRILAGETISSIARDWDRSGMRTTTGKVWAATKIMALLTSARLTGDRSWHGQEIVARDCFPAILDRTTHLELRQLAASRHTNEQRTRTWHLLTGMLLCGECGHVL